MITLFIMLIAAAQSEEIEILQRKCSQMSARLEELRGEMKEFEKSIEEHKKQIEAKKNGTK